MERLAVKAAWVTAILRGVGGAGRDAGLVLTLVIGVLAAEPVLAQQEVQVEFDADGRIRVIDARTARRLGVFVDEYPGFRDARLYQELPEGPYVLEITSVTDDRLVRERIPLDPVQAQELRRDIALRITQRAPGVGADQDGRNRLLGTSTLLGLTFYGWALPSALDADGRSAAALYMLTAGASFFGPWVVTDERPMSRSMAQLAFYGGTRGIAHGLLAYGLVRGDSGSSSDRAALASAITFSLGEGLGGYLLARDQGLDLGASRTVGLTGDLGMAYGGALAHVAGLGRRSVSGAALAGSGAGLVFGHAIRARRDFTAGDVTALTVAASLGAYFGFTVANWSSSDSSRAFTAAAMAGGIGGLALGDRLLRTTEYTEAQGALVALGTVAGGALGLGAAYLIGGTDAGGSLFLTASAAGALGGYGLMHRALAPGGHSTAGSRGGWNLQVNPAAILALSGREPRPTAEHVIPLLRGQYSF